MIEQSGTGPWVFENTKVSVNIACKHEGAMHEGRARCTSRTARVALIGSKCSTRVREVSELSKWHCSQSRHCCQTGVHGAAHMSDALGCWVTGLTVADDISVSAIVGARPSMGEYKSRCTTEEAREGLILLVECGDRCRGVRVSFVQLLTN
jgi:hypothetical protein